MSHVQNTKNTAGKSPSATKDKDEFRKLQEELRHTGCLTSFGLREVVRQRALARSQENKDTDSKKLLSLSGFDAGKSVPLPPLTCKESERPTLIERGLKSLSLSSLPRGPSLPRGLRRPSLPNKLPENDLTLAQSDSSDAEERTESSAHPPSPSNIKEGRYKLHNGKLILISSTSTQNKTCQQSMDITAQAVERAAARCNVKR
eukprot:CAMPEP_0185737632 /NCGR_PEP_ID=MMETSP1171-20130828/30855_1 /TAXON_ID=374046 /ORGANISM="Helicotheca tamensis, Strain CCMP826" /LENGTH=202 /DNA_ID=CAMNT_0028408591 /DNA_START=88 /DNA_END=696 /DNA_ORIENTATION=-